NTLQAVDRRPLQTQVSVAPVTVARVQSQVLVANIDAAGESDLAVHNYELAVVAHIDLDPAPVDVEGQENAAPAAGGAQILGRPGVEPMRAHGVIEHADFHPLLCFLG